MSDGNSRTLLASLFCLLFNVLFYSHVLTENRTTRLDRLLTKQAFKRKLNPDRSSSLSLNPPPLLKSSLWALVLQSVSGRVSVSGLCLAHNFHDRGFLLPWQLSEARGQVLSESECLYDSQLLLLSFDETDVDPLNRLLLCVLKCKPRGTNISDSLNTTWHTTCAVCWSCVRACQWLVLVRTLERLFFPKLWWMFLKEKLNLLLIPG